MSQWTHVNAVIRFDGIAGMTPSPSIRDDIPEGSEGALNVRLEEVGEGAVRFVGTFWGDLRDYAAIDEIMAYFNGVVKGQIIRSGLLEIDVEFDRTVVMQYRMNEDLTSGNWAEISDRPKAK